jgi:adenylyltransferase/sulfurtransferase
VPEIDPIELKRRLDAGEDIYILDVREPHERNICDIGGELIPMGELPGRVRELDSEREIVVYCRTGRRSAHVVGFLNQWGFEKVLNLRGGLHAWADEVDPSVPKY